MKGRILITTLAVLILAGCAGEQATPAAVSGNLVITNGVVIDGTSAKAISDGVVVIAGDRITAVGKAADFVLPPDATRIDAQGGTILPGFINAHVHGGYSDETLKAWAQGGVTTVRDLGNGGDRETLFAFRDSHRDQPQFARLVAVGPWVSVPGGYPMVPWGVDGLAVTSADDARVKVGQLLDDGADLIKMMTETGKTFGRDIPVVSPEEALAVVEVAHERGVPVSAHAMDAKDLARALDAGVDDIAHMIWDPLPDELISRMVADDVYWVPTLELYHYIARDSGNDWDKAAIDNLRRFVEAGGHVALGTDFGGYGAEFDLGMTMIEIESMAAAGMTPMQIILAATANAAHVCNLDAELGTLEAGKAADILIVDGNPLKDLQASGRTLFVLRDGVVIRP